MSVDLEKYVAQAREQKASDEDIKKQLVRSGWPEKDVDVALAPKDTTSFKLPPPPVPHYGMWVAFLYIVLFICLYSSFSCLAGILHFAVDKTFPDTLSTAMADNYGYSMEYYRGLLIGYIAGIVITYPIFVFCFYIARKQLDKSPGIRNFKVRKLLIYITLFITFVALISHLFFTLYGFLQGDATMRSLAHLLVTFLIAGSVFVYLLGEVREDRKEI